MEQAAQPEAPVEDASQEPDPRTDGEEQSGSLFSGADSSPSESGNPSPTDSGPDPLSKFKDAEGNLDQEGLEKSYLELSSKIGQRKEKLLEEARAEERARLGNVPETPADYKLPEKLVDIEGMDVSIPEDDPLLNWFKEYAHQNNMPQAHFEDALKSYMDVQVNNLPNLDQVLTDLGENATARVQATDSWLASNLPSHLYTAVAQHANNKDYIEAMEWLVNKVREPNFSQDEGQKTDTRLTLDELRKMQDDPRYYRDKDPTFIKKVQQGYERLFGNS